MKLSFDELYQIVYTNHNDGGLTGASIVESSTRIAKALEAVLAQQAQPLTDEMIEEWMDANMERPADPRATFYSEDDVRSVWNAVHRMAQQAQPRSTLAPNGFDAERIEEILGRADVPENYDGDEAESWIIMERILPDLKYLADAYRAQQAQPEMPTREQIAKWRAP
jgi:hypothetical protein